MYHLSNFAMSPLFVLFLREILAFGNKMGYRFFMLSKNSAEGRDIFFVDMMFNRSSSNGLLLSRHKRALSCLLQIPFFNQSQLLTSLNSVLLKNALWSCFSLKLFFRLSLMEFFSAPMSTIPSL